MKWKLKTVWGGHHYCVTCSFSRSTMLEPILGQTEESVGGEKTKTAGVSISSEKIGWKRDVKYIVIAGEIPGLARALSLSVSFQLSEIWSCSRQYIWFILMIQWEPKTMQKVILRCLVTKNIDMGAVYLKSMGSAFLTNSPEILYVTLKLRITDRCYYLLSQLIKCISTKICICMVISENI